MRAYVYVCSAHMYRHVHACVCTCMWRPTVDTRYLPYHSLYLEFFSEPGAHWLARVAGQWTLRDPSVSASPLGALRCSPESQMQYPTSAFTSVLGIQSYLAQHALTHGATLPATQPYYCFLICHTREINRQTSRSEFLLNILRFHQQETSGIHVLFP